MLPILLILILYLSKIIDTDLITSVISEKLPIIALILSFAIISNGLSGCGFFGFSAYKIVEKCSGDTRRLIVYLFILSSILTFFTSNDIVILVLTPIIYSICVNARIKNAKLLFLTQFVAANTLSMGLLIGSPTNIIIAESLKIDFLGYFYIMAIPAIFSFFATLTVVEFINRKSKPYGGKPSYFSFMQWEYLDGYRIPARAPWSEFTPNMSRWLWLFVIGVFGLIVVTGLGISLYVACIPLILGSIILVIFESIAEIKEGPDEDATSLQRRLLETIFVLPYGIIGFALSYFSFSKIPS